MLDNVIIRFMSEEKAQQGEYIGTRVPDEFKEEVETRFIKTKKYRNMSDFIRSLIDKEMDRPIEPDYELKEKLLVLLDDPDVAKKIQRK
jgi:Arc/MetJ-type ribon-helix-helix transcriptional regulator